MFSKYHPDFQAEDELEGSKISGREVAAIIPATDNGGLDEGEVMGKRYAVVKFWIQDDVS